MTGGPGGGWRAKGFLLVASSLLSLALAEVVLRVFPTFYIYASMRNVVQQSCTRPHPTVQYVNRENFVGSFNNREFRTTVRINSKGLRDREYPYERTPGAKRCLALGDSYVFGWGVEVEDSVSKVAEGLLKDVEVLNAGCSGWSTLQELEFFKAEASRYKPDIVLLFFVENDPFENALRYEFVSGRLAYAGVPRGFAHDASRWLAKHSALFNFIRQARGAAVEDWGPGSFAPGPEPWVAEEGYLDELVSRCRTAGARLAVVYVPKKDARGAPRYGGWFRSLRSYCSRMDLPLVDLVPEMTGANGKGPVFFHYDDHWTKRGHKVAGRVVAQFLRQQLDS